MIYLMDVKGNFVGTIAYQESDASALAKLKHLVGIRVLLTPSEGDDEPFSLRGRVPGRRSGFAARLRFAERRRGLVAEATAAHFTASDVPFLLVKQT